MQDPATYCLEVPQFCDTMDVRDAAVHEVRWAFYGYESVSGGQLVQEWFDGLLDEEKDEALDTLGYLQALPLDLWAKPQFEALGDGLSEIRFKVNSVKKTYRIYGFFWPQQRRYSYTFLLGKEKKVKNDKRGVEEARKRLRKVRQFEVSIHAFKFSSGADR